MPEKIEEILDLFVRREISYDEAIYRLIQSNKTYCAFGFMAGVVFTLFLSFLAR